MKGGGVRRRKEEALGAGGGQLCAECGYEYPDANPNPRLRRSHNKNCRRKMKMPVVAKEAGVAVHKRRRAWPWRTPVGEEEARWCTEALLNKDARRRLRKFQLSQN